MKKQIKEEDYGVHEAHCCLKHGCKYGYDNCPVVLDKVKQLYKCEDCQYDDVYDDIGIRDAYKEALIQIKQLTTNSSKGELFRIHDIADTVLKKFKY
jgi:hypothetical protein